MTSHHSVVSVSAFLLSHLAGRRTPEIHGLPRGSIVAKARGLFDACQVQLVTGGRQPCYDPDGDVVYMPGLAFYSLGRLLKRPKRYAIDLLHELAHATGHRSRLARPRHTNWGDTSYIREELCAELTAGLLMADLGIKGRPILPHARYLNGWLKPLGNKRLELEMAMARAQQASGYVIAAARRNLSRMS